MWGLAALYYSNAPKLTKLRDLQNGHPRAQICFAYYNISNIFRKDCFRAIPAQPWVAWRAVFSPLSCQF